MFKNSKAARLGASGAQAHSPAPLCQCASACPQSAGFARVPRVARSAPRQQPTPVGAGTLRLLPAAVAGPSLAPPQGIRRAPGHQQRARVIWAVAPPAGALSARLPLASLVRALRACVGRRCGFAAIGARAARALCPRCARAVPALRARTPPAHAAPRPAPPPLRTLRHRCAPPLRAAGYGPPRAGQRARSAPPLAARLWRAALARCARIAT